MSQKIYTNLDIKGNTKIGDIANATSDTDKFLVSDAGVVKYRTGSEMLSDLGVAPGVASNLQHQVKAGVAINKGQAVYVTSADGTNMIVGLASNASEATSSKTMGLLNNTVAINGFANVITEGLLAGLNTIGANAGDPVWLGTGGNLIYGLANKPSAPDHLVFIGIVTRVNANNGEIFVKVQNGFELNEIHDVDLKSSTPVGNQILAFEGAPVNLWKNKTIPSVLGYTPVPTTRTITINGNTQDLSANLSFSIASGVTSFNTRTGAITLTLGDVTTALGYTPYNASNPAGYISSYTETDTLASVTGRGASTSTAVTLSSGGNTFNGHHYFSAYDANGNHYPHYNSGSNNNGSKLNLRMFDNSGNAVLFYLNGSDKSIQWNGNNIWHAGNLTNLNQLANGPGYITSYTETDTLASVTGRGATTGTSITVGGVFTTKGTNPYIQWQNSAGTRLGYIQHSTNLVMSSDTGNIEFTPNSGLVKMLGYIRYGGASAYSNTGLDSNGFYQDVNGTNIYESTMRLQSNILPGVSSYNGLKFGAAAIGNASEGFTIFTGGYDNNRLTINASGNVSIGTTPSSYKFHVAGGQYGTYLKGGDLGTGSDILRLVDASNNTKYLARGDGKHFFTGDTDIQGAVTATSLALDGTLKLAGFGTNSFINGTGDGSSFATYNFALQGWSSMAFYNPTSGGTYPTQVCGLIDFREGRINMKGGFRANGQIVLHEGNFNSWAPTVQGGNASGTWPISITGNADTVDNYHASSFAKQAYVNVGYDFNTLSAENSDSAIAYRLESSVANPPNGSIYNWSLWQQGNSTRGSQIAVGAYGGNEIYFRGANNDSGSYRGWQRVLHDGNYSTYAVPTSRTITINGTTQDLSANRSFTVTANAVETDTLATVTARGNTSTGDVNINGKIRVGSFPNSTTNNGEAWLGRAADRLAGTMTVQLGGNLDRKFEVVDYGWTTVNFSVNGYGAAEASGSMRAPIFYDSNDTSYYIDPAGNGTRAAVFNGNLWITPKSESYGEGVTFNMPNQATWGGLRWYRNGAAGGYSGNWAFGYFGNESNNDVGFHNGTNGWRLDHSFNMTSLGSVRSPIFYDSSDTGYYWNPNTDASHRFQTPSGYIDIGPKNGGTCHIYTDRPSFYFNQTLLVNGNTVWHGGNDGAGSGLDADNVDGFSGDTFYRNLGFGSGFPSWNLNAVDPDRSGFTYSNGGPWTGPFIHIGASGYGLQFNASYGSNGTGISYRTRNGDNGTWNSWWRMYSDTYRPYADDSGTTGQRSFNYLYASSYLESAGAVYGTIFYDNNNRGYYMDPDGTSQLSSIYTNNWVRVQGDSGVYSQDYGGHLRRPVNASHGTWEIFGYNKNGYAGMNVYDPQGYNNNYMHESGNGGLYQQNGNGWVFYHNRGNACLSVMTSTSSSSYKLYVSGSIYAEGDIVAYSDRRKKENIVTVDNALDTVNKLRGVYYNRIDDDSKKRQVGVIAQEIQEVLPEVVTYAKDLDEYGVSYGNITGLLIEAIKEQQTQIEELKELVNKLINK